MTEQAIVIYTGNNQRAVIAFCREATKCNIPFFLITSGNRDTIYLTEYKKHVIHERKSRELNVDELVECVENLRSAKAVQNVFVLPSSEYLNRFLLHHRSKLHEYNIFIPLVEERLYATLSDKISFTTLCESFGISVPATLSNFEKLVPPFVIKPRNYFDKQGKVQFKPILVTDEEKLVELQANIDIEDYFLQQYISGESYYLLIYKSNNGEDVCYSQKNILQQAEGGSIIAAISSDIHLKEIAQDYLKMLDDIDFTGLIMIELRYFDDKYYMIEANPRLWGPSQLFVDANIPIFKGFLHDLGFNIKYSQRKVTDVKYFWYGGLISNYRQNKKPVILDLNFTDDEDVIEQWLEADIYDRIDTNAIYRNEIDE